MGELIETAIPVLTDWSNYEIFARLGQDIVISESGKPPQQVPIFYKSVDYVYAFIQRGWLSGSINQRKVVLKAPAMIFISVEHIMQHFDASPDLRVLNLVFSHRVAEDLRLNMPFSFLQKIMLYPEATLTSDQMSLAEDYLRFIVSLIRHGKTEGLYELIVNLLRSMALMLSDAYREPLEYTAVSRAEEIAGRFIVLAEQYCKEHHSLDWYASEMCLTAKYVASAVKQVTGNTASDILTQNLLKQARSLLSATKMSIQEVASQLGFRNQSHFGTFFRRATGLSPKAYRTSLARSNQ